MYFDKEEFKSLIRDAFGFGYLRFMCKRDDDLCMLLIHGLIGIVLQLMFYFAFPLTLVGILLSSVKIKTKD